MKNILPLITKINKLCGTDFIDFSSVDNTTPAVANALLVALDKRLDLSPAEWNDLVVNSNLHLVGRHGPAINGFMRLGDNSLDEKTIDHLFENSNYQRVQIAWIDHLESYLRHSKNHYFIKKFFNLYDRGKISFRVERFLKFIFTTIIEKKIFIDENLLVDLFVLAAKNDKHDHVFRYIKDIPLSVENLSRVVAADEAYADYHNRYFKKTIDKKIFLTDFAIFTFKTCISPAGSDYQELSSRLDILNTKNKIESSIKINYNNNISSKL